VLAKTHHDGVIEWGLDPHVAPRNIVQIEKISRGVANVTIILAGLLLAGRATSLWLRSVRSDPLPSVIGATSRDSMLNVVSLSIQEALPERDRGGLLRVQSARQWTRSVGTSKEGRLKARLLIDRC
jgi:hypothetical protein